MANVVITSDPNTIKIVYNDAILADQCSKMTVRKSAVDVICLVTHMAVDFVELTLADGRLIDFAYDGDLGPIVDTVDDVAPTSASDLYDKLSALVVV